MTKTVSLKEVVRNNILDVYMSHSRGRLTVSRDWSNEFLSRKQVTMMEDP